MMASREAAPGEGRRGGLLIAALAVLMLTPVVAAAPGGGGAVPQLDVTVTGPSDGGSWYTEADIVNVTVALTNPTEETQQLEINPTCPATLRAAIMPGGQQVHDSAASGCLDQRQALDVLPGETIELAVLTWDLRDESGSLVPNGQLLLTIDVLVAGLSVERAITFQRQQSLPDDVVTSIRLADAPAPGGVHRSGDAVIGWVSLLNTGASTRKVDIWPGCLMQLEVSDVASGGVLFRELLNLPCEPRDGNTVLAAGAEITLGWFDWDLRLPSGAEVADGDYDVSVAPPRAGDAAGHALVTFERVATSAPESLVGPDTPLRLELIVQETSSGLVDLGGGAVVDLRPRFTQVSEDPIELRFTSSCLTQMHVVDEQGRVVVDSRTSRDCTELEVIRSLAPGEVLEIERAEWDLTDPAGCEIDDGHYLIVLSAPEHHLLTVRELRFDGLDTGTTCRAAHQDVTNISLELDGPSEVLTNVTQLDLTADLVLGEAQLDLLWADTCWLDVELLPDGERPTTAAPLVWRMACGQPDAALDLGPQDVLSLSTMNIPLLDVDTTSPLRTGEHIVVVRTRSTPSFESRHTFTYAQPPPVDVPDPDETPVGPTAPLAPGWFTNGSWQRLSTASGTCWALLAETGDRWSLGPLPEGATWEPQARLYGSYAVIDAETPLESCSGMDGSITVLAVLEEHLLPVPQSPGEDASAGFAFAIPAQAAPAVTASVVAVAGVSSLGLAFAVHEPIRIPLSRWWLLALLMVRRGQRGDRDGDYQRGRIMGYLTANPGCHFRAVLGALEMSNGQLAHHIKVLEDEERIWRRKDGRLVRFYSTSISAETEEQELPVPLLTPDPHSLQGRLLGLLDRDGQMGRNPSQRELAARLKVSQQLISHHLRTLERYGLVDRRKEGVRFRYHLTREARYLVDHGTVGLTGKD